MIKAEGSEKDGDDAKTEVDPKRAAKDKRARSLIKMSLSDQIIRKVMKEDTALGIWKDFEKDYQTMYLPNRIYLKQRFASYKMDDRKTIEENLDAFLKMVNDLESLTINISYEDQAIQILTGLSSKFEPLVHTLKYGSGKDMLTVNEVITSAYAKETKLREKGLLHKNKSEAEDLYVSDQGRNDKRGNRSNRNRSKSKGRNFSKQSNSKNDKGCFICGKEGHRKHACSDKGKNMGSSSANVAAAKKEPLILTASVQDTRKEWVMDYGARFHIIPNREALFDLQEGEGGKVLMGNDTYSEIKGVGKIRIRNPDGSIVVLTGVKYMPTMGRSLISCGGLEKSGCNYTGDKFKVKFYKEGKEVVTGIYTDGLYFLQGTVLKGEAHVSVSRVDTTRKWHSRLGRLSLKNMEALVMQRYSARNVC